MTGLVVCERCGHAAFPRPLWCPRCGGDAWRDEPLGPGVVEEATVVRRAPGGGGEGTRVGSVRLDAGPVVVARLDEDVPPGTRVDLDFENGAPVASRV